MAELVLPGGALFSRKWTSRIGRRLARAEQTMRVRIARDELRRLRELTQAINALEAEIAQLVAGSRRSCSPSRGSGLHAAKLVGDIAGADRFATDAKLARAAGLAPIPVSTGDQSPPLDRAATASQRRYHCVAVTAPAATRRPATTSPARPRKARPTARRSAASNATSPAASGNSYARPSPEEHHLPSIS